MNLPKFKESSGFASEMFLVAQMFWLFNVGPSSLCGLATFCKKNNDGLNLEIRLLIFAAVFM